MGECPRRISNLLLGRPQGVVTSHGTVAAYQQPVLACQWATAGMAEVSSQGVRAEVSGATIQPALLPRAGMSEGVASLAGGQAATETPRRRGRAPAACRGGTAATPAEGIRGQNAAGRAARRPATRKRVSRVPRRHQARAWSRSRKTSARFLRPARLLRAGAGIYLCTGLVLRRRLPHGHEPRFRPRAQVFAA